jgi:pyruvate-formate lyase-activating enzyme
MRDPARRLLRNETDPVDVPLENDAPIGEDSSHKKRSPGEAPRLLVSDGCGKVFEIPEYEMVGMEADRPLLPDASDLIPLPQGSDLFELPGRTAVGYDRKRREYAEVVEYRGNPVCAVAAFMAPAHLQLLRAAFVKEPSAERLPLHSYTAVGWRDGEFLVAGTRIDPDQRQDARFMNSSLIRRRARALRRRFRSNRLIRHLVDNCVMRYACPAARNFAMGRWECPLPTSPACNARCLGCISHQPARSGIPSTQDRLELVPTVEEIAETAVHHLERAPRAIVSFGQGCEGEPLLETDLIEESIRAVRKRTDRGVINVNTNASLPRAVERLCRAGLDSMRVSLNSARGPYYTRYYRPRGYGFAQVVESLTVLRSYKKWSSLNYLVFPGFTDQPEEAEALERLVAETEVDMIQTRNLNMDPDWYMDEMGLRGSLAEPMGMRAWIDRLRNRFPKVSLGYFNPPKEEMRR